MISTYLFDLDDTLIDTSIYREIYSEVLSKIKEKTDVEIDSLGLKKNKYGNYDSGELCRSLGLLDLYYSVLESQIEVKEVLHDSVLELFSLLRKKGKKIGIVSNSMLRTIKAYVDKYGLEVDFIFSSDLTGCNKDSPEYWKKLIAAEKLEPSSCLVIGDDNEEDVEVPGKLGFQTFYLDSVGKLGEILVL